MENTITKPEESVAPGEIAVRLAHERAADVVEALNGLEPETAAAVLVNFSLDRAIEILDLPGLESAAEIVQKLPLERTVPLLTGMSADRTAEVFRQMEEPARSEILRRLQGLVLLPHQLLTRRDAFAAIVSLGPPRKRR